ncbi:MAG: DUF2304 domain-containing protein [candidate division WOR-3 bacterium]
MKQIQVIALIAAIGLLIVILELIRRRKLKERFALLWLFSAIILIVFTIWSKLLIILAKIMGIYYAPLVLVPIIILMVIILFIYFSVIVSRQSELIKILSQKIALLEQEIKKSKNYNK